MFDAALAPATSVSIDTAECGRTPACPPSAAGISASPLLGLGARLSAVVVMGVSGCGKSSVAQALAAELGWPMLEGDALHPPANIAKMSAGIPLDDVDRAPWLARIASEVGTWRALGRTGIVTCSALKRRYRDALADRHDDLCFVYLDGSREVILPRLQHRPGHFMPACLLDSQFAALEPPGTDERTLRVPLVLPLRAMVAAVAERLRTVPALDTPALDTRVVERSAEETVLAPV